MPHLWMTYDQAKATSATGHVGFAFHRDDFLWGIDLDDCITPEGITPVASEIVSAADSYTEVSVSGTGLKIWLIGSIPPGLMNRFSHKGQAIEMYQHGRFFLTTENQYGTQGNVRRSPKVRELLKLIAPPPATPTLQAERQQRPTTPEGIMQMCQRHPPAISGSNGHGTTMSLARKLGNLGLDVHTILYYLETHYNHSCQPRWSRGELLHKAQDAVKRR